MNTQKGMTQEEFGEAFRVSKGVVCNWGKGRNLPNKRNIKKIANFGNISIKKMLEPTFSICNECGYDMLNKDFKYCPMCGNYEFNKMED